MSANHQFLFHLSNIADVALNLTLVTTKNECLQTELTLGHAVAMRACYGLGESLTGEHIGIVLRELRPRPSQGD